MTTDEGLRIVGYLLETHGTTGAFARNAKGEGVGYRDPEAYAWCIAGALLYVGERIGLPLYCDGADRLPSSPLSMSRAWDAEADWRREAIARLKGDGSTAR